MPSSGDKLSLGKLGRATGHTSDYVSKISMSQCAGEAVPAAPISMSEFSLDSVDNTIFGYLYVDEQTVEDYNMTFTNSGSRFAKISGLAANYTWTTDDAPLFALSPNANFSASYTAGTIAEAPPGTNPELVVNGDFTTWTGGLPDNWGSNDAGNITEITVVQSPNASDTTVPRFDATAVTLTQSIAVDSSAVYELRVDGKTPTEFANNIDLTVYDSGMSILMTQLAICNDKGWAESRFDVFTSGSTIITIEFKSSFSGSGLPYIDAVSLKQWAGANYDDTIVNITAKYHDAGQADGFNAHATRYNTAITKAVEIQDTYGGAPITCFLPHTKIRTAFGKEIAIEDVIVGDILLSQTIPGMPDESQGAAWKSFTTKNLDGFKLGSATVKSLFFDFANTIYDINSGFLEVTKEHEIWAFRNGMWGWIPAKSLEISDKLYHWRGGQIEITSIEEKIGMFEVVMLDVEMLDVYFASGILVHNKGSNIDPNP